MSTVDLRQLSDEALRSLISSGERTAECWAEIKDRNRRVTAGRAIIRALREAIRKAEGDA